MPRLDTTRSLALLLASALLPASLSAQSTPATISPGPTTDTSVIDTDGTAHITRVVLGFEFLFCWQRGTRAPRPMRGRRRRLCVPTA